MMLKQTVQRSCRIRCFSSTGLPYVGLAYSGKKRGPSRFQKSAPKATSGAEVVEPQVQEVAVEQPKSQPIKAQQSIFKQAGTLIKDHKSSNVIAKKQQEQQQQRIPKKKAIPYKEDQKIKAIAEDFAKQEEEGDYQRKSTKNSKKSDKPLSELRQTKVKINIPGFLTVSNLANLLKLRTDDLLTKLKDLGFENMTYNFILDNETASLIADEYGFEVSINDETGYDLFPSPISEDPKKLKPRSPIVTIMGHVDHGKTTILDYLRKSSIVNKEFGGITQHIGAFSVKTPKSKKMICFLDTPGHAAFLKMRERGANITDIVVLVVAADDSVMPQTKEAIKHAKNAGVQMIVAINKCDKPEANPEKVVSDLAANGIDVEDYGGEIQTVKVSGKTGLGMEDLEEAIVTLAEIQDLKTEDKNIPVEGWVIESQVKKGLGNVATFLVTRGSLKSGSIIVAGNTWCKVKSMKDEFGKAIKLAGPSTPVELTGWRELPEAGDQAIEVKNENLAKKVVANRVVRAEQIEIAKNVEKLNEARAKELKLAKRQQKLEELHKLGLTIEDVAGSDEFAELHDEEETQTNVVPYIVKADVSGSSEAIVESISGLGNDEVKSQVLFHEVGPPTESDVDRASAAGAEILCFNVKIPKDVSSIAAKKGVVLKEFTVIYHLIEDVINELTAKLPAITELKTRATIDIKQVFEISVKRQKVKVAGCRVEDGVLKRNSQVRVLRGGKEVWRGDLSSLKKEKDEVDEVKKGAECGLAFRNWEDFQEGDVVEVYEEEKVKRYL